MNKHRITWGSILFATLVLALFSFAAAGSSKTKVIITIDNTMLYPTPAAQALAVFSAPKGMEFEFVNSQKVEGINWFQIRLADGNKAWMIAVCGKKITEGVDSDSKTVAKEDAEEEEEEEESEEGEEKEIVNVPTVKIAAAYSTKRFEKTAYGSIIDKRTGLEWSPDSGTLFEGVDSAFSHARQLRLGGHSDWRLPTVDELRSIWDPTVSEPLPGAKPKKGFNKFVNKLLTAGQPKEVRIDPVFELNALTFWSSGKSQKTHEIREMDVNSKEDVKKLQEFAKPGSKVGKKKSWILDCVQVVDFSADEIGCIEISPDGRTASFEMAKTFGGERFGALAVRQNSSMITVPQISMDSRLHVADELEMVYTRTEIPKPVNARFRLNHCGSVTDIKTGLEWIPDPGKKMMYKSAEVYAESIDICGQDDWRLPTIHELKTVFDKNQSTQCWGKGCEYKILFGKTRRSTSVYRIDPVFGLSGEEVWSSETKWVKSCPEAKYNNSLLVDTFNFKPEPVPKKLDNMLLTGLAKEAGLIKIDGNDPETHIFRIEAGRITMEMEGKPMPPTYTKELQVLVVRAQR